MYLQVELVLAAVEKDVLYTKRAAADRVSLLVGILVRFGAGLAQGTLRVLIGLNAAWRRRRGAGGRRRRRPAGGRAVAAGLAGPARERCAAISRLLIADAQREPVDEIHRDRHLLLLSVVRSHPLRVVLPHLRLQTLVKFMQNAVARRERTTRREVARRRPHDSESNTTTANLIDVTLQLPCLLVFGHIGDALERRVGSEEDLRESESVTKPL